MRVSAFQFSVAIGFLLGISHCSFASHEEPSSKARFIGVGGWKVGKNCPRLELLWFVEESERKLDNPRVELQFKRDSKTVLTLRKGMAMFSSDCRYFWYTGYLYEHPERHEIRIYDTTRGSLRATLNGYFPAWSQDGTSIFFLLGASQPELWAYKPLTDSKEILYKEKNYSHCPVQGEGVLWHPVVPLRNGLIQWTHGVNEIPKGIEPDQLIGVRLTLDPRGKRVVKRDEEKINCG